MKLNVCTISFRHQLISLPEIAQWAKRRDFAGIELWGVHALNLLEDPEYNADWLRSYGLSVPMVSDYLPLHGDLQAAKAKAERLCQLARRWGAPKLRTFAGDRPSADVSDEEREQWVTRLRVLCAVADANGIQLVVETHPNTLADTLVSTVHLVEEVGHAALRLNFDVIHMWESGCEPAHALRLLGPVVSHMHLKNVATREQLSLFAPPNVYAPAGDREGMVPLFAGAFDYERFLLFVRNESGLHWSSLDASLEWFGPDVRNTLEADCRELRRRTAPARTPGTNADSQPAPS